MGMLFFPIGFAVLSNAQVGSNCCASLCRHDFTGLCLTLDEQGGELRQKLVSIPTIGAAMLMTYCDLCCALLILCVTVQAQSNIDDWPCLIC
jgi:hypothetical protein